MLTQIEFFDTDSYTNLISILSMKPDKVIFIYDREVSTYSQIKQIYQVCQLHRKQLQFEAHPVDSNNLENICNLVQKSIPEKENCVIDLTGGMNMMTVAGYKVGAQNNLKLICVDTQENKVINVLTNEIICDAAMISFDDYLKSKGAAIIGFSHNAPKEDEFTNLYRMCDYVFRHPNRWKRTCNYLQASMAEKDELVLRNLQYIEVNQNIVSPDSELLKLCEELGYIVQLQIDREVSFLFTSEKIKQYLLTIGIWLELYVYMEVCKVEGARDIKLGAKIDWNSNDGIMRVGNEIDIVCSIDSKPILISCKFTEPNIAAINEILINAKRIGGNRGKGIIVAFSDMKQADTSVFHRAKELGIWVFDRKDILSNKLGELIQKVITVYQI